MSAVSDTINKFLRGLGDLIREDKGGKVSSKKDLGTFIYGLSRLYICSRWSSLV